MTFNKAELGAALKKALELNDYRVLKNTHGGICFERSDPESTIILDFAYTRFVEGYSFRNGVSGRKLFPQVEDFLGGFYKKYNIPLNFGTIWKSSGRVNFEEKFHDHRIASERTLNEVKPILKSWIYDEILPFFDSFNCVADVYEKMESMPLSERNWFVYSPMSIRALIMKGMLKTEDFFDYGSRLGEFLNRNKNDLNYTYQNKYFDEMFEELKRMQ